MGEPDRPLERGFARARHGLRRAGAGDRARAAGLTRLPRPLACAAAGAAGTLVAFGLARAFGPSGAEGLFRGGLAAVVAALLALAFVPLPLGAFAAAAGGAALALAGAFLVAGAGVGGALSAAALLAGLALAAAGFAALGRRIGAGTVAAGAVSATLLAVALQGLFWADDVAERLPREGRFAFRQAVLELDAATALACDAAGFDRLHHPPVYASVPLAASTHARPTAPRTGLVWGAFGILAGGVAAVRRGTRPIPARP